MATTPLWVAVSCASGLLTGPLTLQAQTLQATTPSQSNVSRVEIFADGNIRNVVSQPSDVTSATGSLGMRYLGPTYIASGLINVAGQSDTVTTGYGATLLAPSAGKALNAGLLDIRRRYLPFLSRRCSQDPKLRRKLRCHIGLHGYASVASWRWATGTDSVGTVLGLADVPVWGTGLGMSYTFFNGVVGDGRIEDRRSVAMVLDLGLTTRHIRGDLFKQDSVRKNLLDGEGKRDFAGLEIGLNLQYSDIRAGLTYYFMNGDIRGFSHGQVVAGVSVQANLSGGPVRSPEDAEGNRPNPEPADSAVTEAPADSE